MTLSCIAAYRRLQVRFGTRGFGMGSTELARHGEWGIRDVCGGKERGE